MKKGKLTLPLLLLLEHTEADRRASVGEIIFHGAEADRRGLINVVLGNGVIQESVLMLEQHVEHARTKLAVLSDNTYTRTLNGMMDFVSQKTVALMKGAVAA